MAKWNIAKTFLFYLFKVFVLPVLQAKIQEAVTKATDNLIKSRYNDTTVADVDDIKHHLQESLTEFSESWLDE